MNMLPTGHYHIELQLAFAHLACEKKRKDLSIHVTVVAACGMTIAGLDTDLSVPSCSSTACLWDFCRTRPRTVPPFRLMAPLPYRLPPVSIQLQYLQALVLGQDAHICILDHTAETLGICSELGCWWPSWLAV